MAVGRRSGADSRRAGKPWSSGAVAGIGGDGERAVGGLKVFLQFLALLEMPN